MKSSTRLLIWLLIAISAPLALSQRSSYDPAANNRNDRRGFADFVLKQINPQNNDYGCEIEEARKLVVAETVKNIDFWTIVVALGLLIFSFFILISQHRNRDRLEVLGARFLSQYHNALVDAHNQANRVIRRHNELVSATDRVVEKVQLGHPPDLEPAVFGSEPIHTLRSKSPTTIALKKIVTRNQAVLSEPLATKTLASPNSASEVDLIAQIKNLQRQLAASHEREKNLKGELNKVRRNGQGEPMAKA